MLTKCGQLSATLGMVAIFAHAVSVILLANMSTFRNEFSVLLSQA